MDTKPGGVTPKGREYDPEFFSDEPEWRKAIMNPKGSKGATQSMIIKMLDDWKYEKETERKEAVALVRGMRVTMQRYCRACFGYNDGDCEQEFCVDYGIMKCADTFIAEKEGK